MKSSMGHETMTKFGQYPDTVQCNATLSGECWHSEDTTNDTVSVSHHTTYKTDTNYTKLENTKFDNFTKYFLE